MTSLRDRIRSADRALREVSTTLDRAPALPTKLTEHLRQLAALQAGLGQASAIIDAREAALGALQRVDENLEAGDKVQLWGVPVAFADARFLLVQAYLSTSRSLADLLTSVAGRFVCIESVGKNEAHPAKLWENFHKDAKSLPNDLSAMLRQSYAFPVAVSYAVRNHFVHDGAQNNGMAFFEGVAGAQGFRVSDSGWRFIEAKVLNEYGVSQTRTLAPEPWPWPQEDLRKVLAICEREMDIVLGIVIHYAAVSFRTQVGLLTEDR